MAENCKQQWCCDVRGEEAESGLVVTKWEAEQDAKAYKQVVGDNASRTMTNLEEAQPSLHARDELLELLCVSLCAKELRNDTNQTTSEFHLR
jgi:hypothetical protein